MSQVGFFLYIGDWIKDTRCLSPAARGCWVDSLCYLYDRGGSVEQDMEAYGFWWSISPVSAAEILLEFERTSVADVKWQNDSKGMAKNDKTVIAKLSNRRMVRETQKRLETKEKRAEAGRAGANKRWQNVDGKNAVLPSPSLNPSLNPDKNKNKRGVGRKTGASGFSEFWAAYPIKSGKGLAEKAWRKHDPPLDQVLLAIEGQRQWRANGDGSFRPEWKHPATWLNAQGWLDEIEPEPVASLEPYVDPARKRLAELNAERKANDKYNH